MRYLKLSIIFSLFAALGLCQAESTPEIEANLKKYSVIDFKLIVDNNKHCGALYQSLSKAFYKPIVLAFAQYNSSYLVKESSNAFKNFSHRILSQTINEHSISRVGTGSFEFNQAKIDYIIQVTANLDNPSHKYTYPLLLSSNNGQCAFTALLKPSAETLATFKKHIQSGGAKRGTDLTGQ